MAESQASTFLDERLFDDPSQLSQLLRQRAGSDRQLHFTTSPESHQSAIAAAVSTFAIPQQPNHAVAQQLPDVPALFNHAAFPRRVANARHVKPRLSNHHSAPTSTELVKEKEGPCKMHHSFAGMDTPGDTQPDSQIYKEWTSEILGTGEVMPFSSVHNPKSLFTEHVEEDDGDRPTDGSELVASSQDHQSPTVTSPTVIQDDDLLGALPMGNYALTSPLKFETPAIAGRKRDSSGQMLSSAVRTNTTPGTVVSTSAFPGFAFADIAPMSLTQVWQNTQAPTSPAQAEGTEDVAFTRPSPNFTHARHSSPIPALSSPIKATRDDSPRTDPIIRSSSEPRAEYVSMKESQERRKRTTREQPVQLVEQDSWETPTAAQLRIQRRSNREDLERKAAISFAHISAPALISSEPSKKRGVNAKHVSPRKSRPARRSRSHNDDNFADELAHPIPTNAQIDDDSPDELSQDMPTTTRIVVKHNSRDNSVQVPKTSSHPTRTQSAPSPRSPSQDPSPSSQLQRGSQFQAPVSQPLLRTPRPPSSKDSVAVMDSQPDAAADYGSVSRPKSLRFPSSPSMNQYSINQTTMATKTGYTSQVISSSVPPMPPPKSSPDEVEGVSEEDIIPEGDERVPSSPPVMRHEDDLTYDEHERPYDEYAEEGAMHDSVEPQGMGEDVAMDEDDDLPVTEPEPEVEETSLKDEDMQDDELDLVQPLKVDLGTDQEIPETLEQDQLQDDLLEKDRQAQSPRKIARENSQDCATPKPPRVQRQSTVPETDALDETQPSFFPEPEPALHDDEGHVGPPDDSDAPIQTNSTEPFQTAREQPSGSQDHQPPPSSPREGGSDTIQMGERLRSLQDIHNLPDTQQSTAEEEIEMPRLSGLDENEEIDFMPVSSPAPPSGKRRKVTYTAKRNVFRSPLKSSIAEVQPDLRPSSPTTERHQAPIDTPPTASAQEQEQRGNLAALHARENAQAPYTRQATLKSKAAPRPLRAQAQKKGALKPVPRDLLMSLSSPVNSPLKPKSAFAGRTSAPVTPVKQSTGRGHIDADTDMPNVNEERDELADPTPETDNTDTVVRADSDRGETPTGDVLVPNRVFASWPGSHFYPATCLGRVAARQLQIRFDDGNITSLDATQVRTLDLRLGDHVKVDETGMKKRTYIIVGFKDKIDDTAGEEFPTTDRHGYTTLVLEEKLRDSLLKGKAVQSAQSISAPMGSIYLTTQLWTRFRDRSFNFSPPASPSGSVSRIGTPVPALDGIATSSFARRGITVPSLLRDATARAASVASSSTRSGSGVFSDMAFVLTSTAADVDKEAIAEVIRSNGGQILDQGFHELFDSEAGDPPSASQTRRRSASAVEDSVGLSLKHQYKDLGFVALISDSHSRSTKYIQALALNVPCLHLRWIQDSLSTSRAVPFTRYLLPAGVSKFLDPNGVVRSRTMNVYDPAADDLSFAQTISVRDLLLHDQTVLLVTGKSKKEIEKRQPFIFLTHALGSARVGRCADLAVATEMLQDGWWDWVYVDNGEQGVTDAAAELFGNGKPAASGKPKKGRKRKRDETEEQEQLVAEGEYSGKRVRVMCSEFVIQSLILGALVEE